FFQAEDGIRDGHVTGVQTCTLPIYRGALGHRGIHIFFQLDDRPAAPSAVGGDDERGLAVLDAVLHRFGAESAKDDAVDRADACEIGRASCRERVWVWVWDGGVDGRR